MTFIHHLLYDLVYNETISFLKTMNYSVVWIASPHILNLRKLACYKLSKILKSNHKNDIKFSLQFRVFDNTSV